MLFFKAIRFLVEQDPATLRSPDGKGDTPLHKACRGRPIWGIFDVTHCQYLVHRDRAPLLLRNNDGELPIHLGCRFHTDGIENIVECLLEHDEAAETLTAPDSTGACPLHHLVLRHVTSTGTPYSKMWNKKIQTLAKKFVKMAPQVLSLQQHSGDLPVTLAAKKASLDLIFEFLHQYPDFIVPTM